MLQEVDISDKGGNSFKDLVMNQFVRVTTFANVEFRGGFYTKILGKDGAEKEIYVPDTRDIFCNGSFILALFLQPSFSEDMKADFKGIREQLDILTKEFIEKSSVEETVILGDAFYQEDKDKILLEEYKNKKLIVHLKLYSRLSKELKRKNYFEMEGVTY
jgi:hypothetical protein